MTTTNKPSAAAVRLMLTIDQLVPIVESRANVTAAIDAELQPLIEALEAIAAEDHPVNVAPESFSVHAVRRHKEIAQAALKRARGEEQ